MISARVSIPACEYKAFSDSYWWLVVGITALMSKSAFSPSVVASSSTVDISEFTGIASNEKIEMLAYQVSGL